MSSISQRTTRCPARARSPSPEPRASDEQGKGRLRSVAAGHGGTARHNVRDGAARGAGGDGVMLLILLVTTSRMKCGGRIRSS
eukprot:6173858-Pleurochrysis_carterae.AAC.1